MSILLLIVLSNYITLIPCLIVFFSSSSPSSSFSSSSSSASSTYLCPSLYTDTGSIVMAPILTLVYSCFFTFILLTMLIAIINEAFVDVIETHKISSGSKGIGNYMQWLQDIAVPALDSDEATGVKGKIRLVLRNHQDLSAGGEFGGSDPYCKIFVTDDGVDKHAAPSWEMGKNAYQSEVLGGTGGTKDLMTSFWNERTELTAGSMDTTVVISVWDNDAMSADEFLGQAVVRLGDISDDGAPTQVELALGEMRRVGGALTDIATLATRRETTEEEILAELRKPHGAYGDKAVNVSGKINVVISYLKVGVEKPIERRNSGDMTKLVFDIPTGTDSPRPFLDHNEGFEKEEEKKDAGAGDGANGDVVEALMELEGDPEVRKVSFQATSGDELVNHLSGGDHSEALDEFEDSSAVGDDHVIQLGGVEL